MSKTREPMSQMLTAALRYADHGWHVFPCQPGLKRPLPGSHGCLDATTDLNVIREWWETNPDANVAVACGPSGLAVVDIDKEPGGYASWQAIVNEHGDALGGQPLQATTPSGGRHLVYAAPAAGLKNSTGKTNKLGLGLDIRADGGYIVVVPSVTKDGTFYAWDKDMGPSDLELVPFPQVLLDRLNAPAPQPPMPPMPGPMIPEAIFAQGQRNDGLARLAGGYRRQGLPPEQLLALLLSDNNNRCRPPMPVAEVERIARGMERYEGAGAATPGRPRVNYNEMATGFVNAHQVGGFCRYRLFKSNWYRYTGHYYKLISIDHVKQAIVTFLRDRHAGHANSNAVSNILLLLLDTRLAGTSDVAEAPCWLDQDDALADGWLVMKNKAVNVLKLAGGAVTGVVGKLSPALFATGGVDYDYDLEAKCPKWEAYLAGVQPLEADRLVLQKLFGLMLVPITRYNVAFFLYGEGGTGKSVFINVLRELVGQSNTCLVPLASLMSKFSKEPLTRCLVNLVGDSPTETGVGNYLARIEGLFKETCSGGYIEIENKHQKPTNARVIARNVFATNSIPRFFDRSTAIWDRLRLIAFDVLFRGTEKDNEHLTEELIAEELPGIFIWAIVGLNKLLQEKWFPEHSTGLAKKQKQRELGDPEGAWLREQYELAPGQGVSTRLMYSTYKLYADDSGLHALGMPNFCAAVERVFGIVKGRRRESSGEQTTVFNGLGIKTPA